MFDWGPFDTGSRRTIGNVTVSVRHQASEILLRLLRGFTRVRNAYLLRDFTRMMNFTRITKVLRDLLLLQSVLMQK